MHSRSELLHHLDRTRQELREAADAIPVDRRSEPASPARWSAAEIVEHLSIVERRVVILFRELTAAALAANVPATSDTSVVDPVFASRLVDRTRRIESPERARPAGIGWDASWTALEESRAQIRTLIASTDGVDLGGVSAPHPALGPLTFYQWVVATGGHEARHAAQIREIAGAFGDGRALL